MCVCVCSRGNNKVKQFECHDLTADTLTRISFKSLKKGKKNSHTYTH